MAEAQGLPAAVDIQQAAAPLAPELTAREHTAELLVGMGYGEAELQEFVPQQPGSNRMAK